MISKYVLAIATCAPLLASPTVVWADGQLLDAAGYDGGKARVNSSARLRALTEHLASSSCRVSANVDTDVARAELTHVRADFERLLNGLENGDVALGIPSAETRAASLNAMNEVKDILVPMEDSIERIIDGSASVADTKVILDGRANLFDRTFVLASEISGQYSNPLELLQADAITLDFAGRQRAMIQRAVRTVCELHKDPSDQKALEELNATVNTIENSLVALRDGYPAAGISAPPNEAVRNGLSEAYDLWRSERELLDGIANGANVSEEQVIEAAKIADEFTKEMNNAITLYLIASPGQDGVFKVPLRAYIETELANWLENPSLISALRAQNLVHDGMSEDDIIALDQKWRAEASAGEGELISQLLEHQVSQWLVDKQDATSGFVTEVFVMDNKGLNVAQSAVTSDYWQGDEAKWQQTFKVGPDAIHISDVEFDDSTGFYQSQASLSITDPESGDVIGAVTFGINVQNLM